MSFRARRKLLPFPKHVKSLKVMLCHFVYKVTMWQATVLSGVGFQLGWLKFGRNNRKQFVSVHWRLQITVFSNIKRTIRSYFSFKRTFKFGFAKKKSWLANCKIQFANCELQSANLNPERIVHVTIQVFLTERKCPWLGQNPLLFTSGREYFLNPGTECWLTSIQLTTMCQSALLH